MRRRPFRRRESVRQFRRFVVVGVANTVLSFAAYRLLLAIGTPYVLAAAIAFSIGAVNGFVFNRRWTFGAPPSARARLRYVAIQVLGVCATSVLVLFSVRVAGTGKPFAYLAAIPPVTVCMFLANRIWTFADGGGRVNPPEQRAPSSRAEALAPLTDRILPPGNSIPDGQRRRS
jgi:putative flippase GtrA